MTCIIIGETMELIMHLCMDIRTRQVISIRSIYYHKALL